jgi:hypothetical protein
MYLVLNVRFLHVRCTKRYVCPSGRYNKSNVRTNRGTTKVHFDQAEVSKVKVVSVADGGKLKFLKTKGEV